MTAPDPRYLATAIEVVTAAGAIQRARFGSTFRVDKKGTIDLVTEVDVEVEPFGANSHIEVGNGSHTGLHAQQRETNNRGGDRVHVEGDGGILSHQG